MSSSAKRLSPFEQIPPEHWIASNDTAFAVLDAFPVSAGHSLVITKRRIATWWESTEMERRDVMALVDLVKARLDAELRPEGYNVGFNAGDAAGQTVPHLHVHVIPRFTGDGEDPRGGIRNVIPESDEAWRPRVERVSEPGGRANVASRFRGCADSLSAVPIFRRGDGNLDDVD
jgi:diadenosine tetraphosphate (Ap4A) HIT family hydrolase